MTVERWCRQHGTHGAGTCPADRPVPADPTEREAAAEITRLRDLVDEFRKRDEVGTRVIRTALDERDAARAEAADLRRRLEALEGLRELSEAATPGPWVRGSNGDEVLSDAPARR